MRLATLGTLRLDGATLRRAKLLALLAYLTVQGPTPRRQVWELFWPDAQQPDASLRAGVYQLRQHAAGALTGSAVLTANLSCDALDLLTAVVGGDDLAALNAHAGPFLYGAPLDDVSAELDEWVLETRERLATTAQRAGLRAAERAGSPATATLLAERAYRLAGAPPMSPELLRGVLALSLPGSALEGELRAELRGLQLPTEAPRPAAARLIGRQAELGQLLQALRAEDARLVQVTGPGGIGKSALVAAALREHAALSGERVGSVTLEQVPAASEAVARLAGALGLTLHDQGDSWGSLADALGDGAAVLALDGAEGLPDLMDGVQALLDQCPGVRVVVGSRRRFPGSGAHLALIGLGVPDSGAGPAEVAVTPAAQLFAREAARVQAGFALNASTAPQVAAIVRRLDGHPLAIEMTASWVRTHALGAIHDLILRDVATLQAEYGQAERHQLAAVFERSWELLPAGLRAALPRLALFADCTPEAALAVAGVPQTSLSQLEAHSLLVQQRGRYRVPPVLVPLALARLAAADPAREAHADHYVGLLQDHAPESAVVAAERSNIAVAMRHRLQTDRVEPQQLDLLLAHYDRLGLLSAGADVFSALQDDAALANAEPAARAAIQVALAWLALRTSRLNDAERLARALIEDPRLQGTPARMKACNIWSGILQYRGREAEALEPLREAIRLAKQLGDEGRATVYLGNLAALAQHAGAYAEARTTLQTVIEAHQRAGRTAQALSAQWQDQSVLFVSEQHADADLLEQARRQADAFRAAGMTTMQAHAELGGAQLAIRLGRAPEALRAAEGAYRMAQQTGFELVQVMADLCRARALYMLGRSTAARQALRRGLDLARRTELADALIEALLVVADDLLDAAPPLAWQAIRCVQQDRRASAYNQLRARRWLESQAEAAPAGPTLSLEQLADEVRAWLAAGLRPAAAPR